jgi:hypothetical protein
VVVGVVLVDGTEEVVVPEAGACDWRLHSQVIATPASEPRQCGPTHAWAWPSGALARQAMRSTTSNRNCSSRAECIGCCRAHLHFGGVVLE